MGGSISLVAARGRRATHTLIAAALALVLLALLAGTAAAQSAGTRVAAVGMTTPAGVAVTPDGDVWGSDALYGLCPVSPDGAVGASDALSGLAHVSRVAPDRDEIWAPEPVEPATPPVPEGTVELPP